MANTMFTLRFFMTLPLLLNYLCLLSALASLYRFCATTISSLAIFWLFFWKQRKTTIKSLIIVAYITRYAFLSTFASDPDNQRPLLMPSPHGPRTPTIPGSPVLSVSCANPRRASDIEPTQPHHLAPGPDKIVNETGLCIVVRIHLGNRTQLGV